MASPPDDAVVLSANDPVALPTSDTVMFFSIQTCWHGGSLALHLSPGENKEFLKKGAESYDPELLCWKH